MNFTLTGTILGHDHRPVVGQTFVVFPSSGHTPSEHGVHLPPARLITDMAGRLRRLGALPGEDGVDIPMVEGQRFTLQATNGSYRSVSFYPAPGEVLDVREITPVSTTNPSASLVRGASAYEVAVANGFVGTPTQWVSSLTIEGMEPPPVVTDHQALVNRDADDAHPISSITDLAPALSSIVQALDAKVDHGYTGYVTDDDDRLNDARTPLPHTHDLDDVDGLGDALAGLQPAGDYLTAADLPEIPEIPDPPDLSDVVRNDDPRLSDERVPVDHEHQIGDVEGLAASLADFQPKGEYLTAGDLPEPPDVSDVVREGDPRLSDLRDPTAHRHPWSELDDVPEIPATPEDIGAQPAGDYATRDEIPEVPPAPDLSDLVRTDDPRMSDARPPTDHDHPEYQPSGDYLTPEDLPAPTDLSGLVRDDDPRLSDSRAPTEHDHDDRYVRSVNGNGPDETGNVTVAGGGGEGGTDDHRALSYRSAPDAHPISAITGLTDALESKQPAGDYLTSADLPEPPDVSDVVREGDPRLSDARDPNQHRHAWADLDDVPAIPSAPEDIGAQPAGNYLTSADLPEPPDLSDVVREDDPRLSDAREPTAHDHPEYLTAEDVPEFPDLSAFVETDDSRLSDARTPLDHRHDMEDVEGLWAALADFQPRGEYLVPGDLPDLSDVVREDDERLSDARTPTDHRHTWSDLDDTPAIPASPEDIGAQPAGDYLTAEDLPEAPDLSDVIREGDERLSDPRQPTSHRHNWSELDGVPSIPQSPEDIGAQPAGDYATRDEIPEVPPAPDLTGYVTTDDARLSDARPPVEHRHDYADLDGTPAIPAAPEDIGAQPAGDYAPSDHDHDGVYQPVGDYLGPADLPDLSGLVQDGDPRLSDARPPTSHEHDAQDVNGLSTVAVTGAYSDLDGTPAIPTAPQDIGAQPAGQYLTASDLPPPPDLSDVVRTNDARLSDARPPTDHRHDYSDLDGVPTIPSAPQDIGAQPAGDYLTAQDLPAAPTWSTLAGKPAVIAAGTSQTAARGAIGAGTSSLQLGTGPTTAAAGDHGHTLNETTDTATRVAMTPAERTKLGGVAANATANSTDAQLRDRGTHTGEQGIDTVAGLQTALDGKITAAPWGILPTIYVNPNGTWPSRTLPSGYAGPVNWDSASLAEASQPSGAVDGDRWHRQAAALPPNVTPSHVGQATGGTGGTPSFSIAMPASSALGDVALLFLDAMNNTLAEHTLPSGWTHVGRARGAQNVTSDLYAKTLTAGDFGPLTVTTGQADIRINAQLVVYRDVDLSAAMSAWDTMGGGADVTTPTVTAVDGSIVVEHVTNRGNPVATEWTPPAGVTERLDEVAPGGAAQVTVSSATGDIVGADAGTVGGNAWTRNVSTNHEAAWTISLPPAG